MIIVLASQFHIYLPWGQRLCLNTVLIVKALVGAFNQENALIEAFSVIVKTDCETVGLSAALGLGILGSKERGVVLVMSQAAAGVETSL